MKGHMEGEIGRMIQLFYNVKKKRKKENIVLVTQYLYFCEFHMATGQIQFKNTFLFPCQYDIILSWVSSEFR